MAQRPRKATAAEVRSSLEAQLSDRGANVAVYQAQIDSYMFFFAQERAMQRDIKHRGFEIEGISAQGKPYTKENPSVKAAALYNKQQLQILKELNLNTDNCRTGTDDGDDL